ncbi:MAG: ATP-binding cassette domain-containing protein, partial [Rectinema sp.]|nr:ATP-binding cassette domain-containing protein [Rectinema sp.]
MVKAFAQEEREISRFSGHNLNLYDSTVRFERVWPTLFPLPWCTVGLGEIIVWYLGGREVVQGTMTIGTLMLFVFYLGMFYGPLQFLSRIADFMSRSLASAERVFEIMDCEADLRDAPDAISLSACRGEVEIKDLTFGYDPHKPVLKEINLNVKPGEMLGIVGHSGAGKTTLMNILMGLYQPDEGRILINGRDVRFRTPLDAYRMGIGMVHQHFMLVPNLTVAENIVLGAREYHKFLRLDMAGVQRRIREISERYSLPVQPDAYIWQLSVGEQQRVELVKTLCLGARFLILDEPTSALTPQETDELIELLKRMAEDMSIIFISHKLAEVTALSDRVAILRQGRVVFHGSTAGQSVSKLAALMTGHEVVLPCNECAGGGAKDVLVIDNLSVRSDRGFFALDGLSLSVRQGEILGLAGVSGNGQRELADALAGLRKVES